MKKQFSFVKYFLLLATIILKKKFITTLTIKGGKNACIFLVGAP